MKICENFYQCLERMWQRRNRDQIRKIQSIVELIKNETPAWFDDEGKESRIDRRINMAIKIYRLRREDIQTLRNIAWIIFAIGGAIYTYTRIVH